MSQAREEDIQFLEGKVKSNPESLLFARLADLYLKSNRVSDAIHICEEGIKKYPFYATGHFVLGRGYLANKQFEQAEKEFKRVLLFDPKYLAAHKNYGDLMKEIGWENTCESSYRKILQIDPLDEIARSVVGEHVLHAGDNAAEPRRVENGQQEMSVETRSIGPTDETVRSVSPPLENPTDDADQAFNDAAFDWDQPQTYTSTRETTPVEIKQEEVNPEPEIPPAGTGSPEEPKAFDFNASDWEEAVSEKKERGISNVFDFDSLGPMPVDSDEEEDLLFKDDGASTTSSLLDDDNLDLPQERHKEEEFSYLLDDIFKDEVSSANPDSDLSIDAQVDEPDGDVPDDDDSQDPWEGLQMDTVREDDKGTTKTANNLKDKPSAPGRDAPEEEQDAQDVDEGHFESILKKGLSSPAPVQRAEAKSRSAAPKVEHQPVKAGKSSGDKIVTPTLGEIYAAQGQYSKAIDVFETLLKKYPDNDIYVGKIAQLKKKLADEAQS